jgi:N-acetylmuramoyl-L-alanine amidase
VSLASAIIGMPGIEVLDQTSYPASRRSGSRQVPRSVNPLLFEYREAIRIITDPGHGRDDPA